MSQEQIDGYGAIERDLKVASAVTVATEIEVAKARIIEVSLTADISKVDFTKYAIQVEDLVPDRHLEPGYRKELMGILDQVVADVLADAMVWDITVKAKVWTNKCLLYLGLAIGMFLVVLLS